MKRECPSIFDSWKDGSPSVMRSARREPDAAVRKELENFKAKGSRRRAPPQLSSGRRPATRFERYEKFVLEAAKQSAKTKARI